MADSNISNVESVHSSEDSNTESSGEEDDSTLTSVGPSNDNLMEQDRDNNGDNDMEGTGASKPADPTKYKDGDSIEPGPDGQPPEAPEGFSIVSKENGQLFLKKRRYSDLIEVSNLHD